MNNQQQMMPHLTQLPPQQQQFQQQPALLQLQNFSVSASVYKELEFRKIQQKVKKNRPELNKLLCDVLYQPPAYFATNSNVNVELTEQQIKSALQYDEKIISWEKQR